jgi:hypothetical protein
MLFSHDPDFHKHPPGKWVKYQRDGDSTWHILFSGYEAIVDPMSKAKKHDDVRGRHCRVLWIGEFTHMGKVVIEYLDSGKRGERSVYDLIPIPPKPVNLAEHRQQNPIDKTS